MLERIISSISHCVASSWIFSLHIINDALSKMLQTEMIVVEGLTKDPNRSAGLVILASTRCFVKRQVRSARCFLYMHIVQAPHI